ncbi:MAG: Protein AaeX [Pseudomonas citronellolis]|nr:MAG: Protein AaeX [Pseudomonas citronellolis]
MLTEWPLGGVYLSPLFIYALAALGLTFVLRRLLQLTPFGRLIWHEALFDCALFVLLLAGITWCLAGPTA